MSDIPRQPQERHPRGDAADFRRHLASASFMLSRCHRCGAVDAPNVDVCEGCESRELDWQPALGTATLISWATHGSASGEQSAVIIAEFAEGPWWWGRLALEPGLKLRVGLPLIVGMTTVGDDVIPEFTVANEGH